MERQEVANEQLFRLSSLPVRLCCLKYFNVHSAIRGNSISPFIRGERALPWGRAAEVCVLLNEAELLNIQ